MLHPVRSIVFGALAVGALASCAADSTSGTSLPPMVPSTTAFATLPPVTSPPTTQPGETTTVPPGAPSEYVVQYGDYLYGIAKQHGVRAEDIVTINGWASVNQSLVPGQTILIPAAGGATTTAATGGGATPPPESGTPPADGSDTTAGGDATTVAPGDGTTSSTTTSTAPEGGQEYTVKNNDTVYGIARKFGITPQALVAANGWSDVSHPLYPGDKIIVPAAG